MAEAMLQRNHDTVQYITEEALISKALVCLENRLRFHTEKLLNNSRDVSAYAQLQLAQEQEEIFAAIFLNNNHQLISFEKLFYGTISETAVYPRKVIKQALKYNAAKIIITHNHPSNNCNPSTADKEITHCLKKILDIIDVQLIDHIIVSCHEIYSFAQHGLL